MQVRRQKPRRRDVHRDVDGCVNSITSINMTAASFLADFHRRMSCTTNVMLNREFDDAGQRQAIGSGCAACPGCETISGVMGVAATGYLVERNQGQFSLAWSCPACGTKVIEATTPLTSAQDAKTISADPICFSCRKPKRSTHEPKKPF